MSNSLTALETLNSKTEKLRLPSPIADPPLLPADELLYSEAALSNVEKIILGKNEACITGVVLYYSNGRRASLGWFSSDSLAAAEKVDSCCLWLRVEKKSVKFPQIMSISCRRPAMESKYFHIKWSGALAWWFSFRQCQLFYDGQQTPVLRL